MSDREPFREARDAGLAARHETRVERAIRRQVAEEIAQALEAVCDEIGDGEQRELFTDMAKLAREIGAKENIVTTLDPSPIDLVRELREALGLPSSALPISPKQAWEEAIAHVRGMAEGRCSECMRRERRPRDHS